MTSRNQGLSPNDKGRQRRESLETRLKRAMSSKSEHTTWSRDTDKWTPYFDNCQLTITRMSNIKDLPMVMVLLLFFKGTDVSTDSHVTTKLF